MRVIHLILLMLTVSVPLMAQTPVGTAKPANPPPLPVRDVSGIVRDDKDEAVPGATVFLKSAGDSLLTTTNNNGIFIFKQVKRASFYITVSGVGIAKTTKLYRNSDIAKQIVLNPFELKPPKAIELKEVTVNGAPTIIYKTDTVEYRASDYKVREGDTVDELLKKAEGFEVGRDGTLVYQGQEVKNAKLNGKTFVGGNVAQTIQNLPADIVEKFQVIDDYGEQAARTGVKTGDPVKTLNITTKPDRSVGVTSSVMLQAGNQKRYNGNANLTHINANRQIAVLGRVTNSQTGVSSGTSGGGGAGTTLTANPSISYSDEWKSKLKLTTNYNYGLIENTSTNKSFGETYSSAPNSDLKNISYFNRESTNSNNSYSHRFGARLSYDLNKANYLQIDPSINRSNSNSLSNSLTDNINNFYTGFEHSLVKRNSNNSSNTNTYGISVLYQHIFSKPRRNFSAQLGVTRNDTKSNGEQFTNYRFFADSTQNVSLRDSVAHLLTRRTNANTSYNASLTYVEPLSPSSQLEITGKTSHTVYDNVAKQDTVLANGQFRELTRLSNIFNYAFTETRLAVNYTYNSKKINLSLGASAIPSVLGGTRVNNNTNQNVSSSISNFRAIPVFRFTYIWSAAQRLSFTYNGNNSIPDFQQIQPFTDRSDPINIVTGNPNLKPTFTNSITASYNHYIANSKVNITLSVNASETKNRVVSNVLQRPELIATSPDRYRTIFETTYINLNGANNINGNYSLSKQLANRKYSLILNGTVNYGYNVAMSNSREYHTTTWRVNERFGPKINPNDNIEISPYISYDISRSFTSLAGANPTSLQTTSLALEGRFYLGQWRLIYDASKNFVTGLGNLNTNPLVINAGVERRLTKKNNLNMTFNVYDLLHQNNFVQQVVTPQGVTNTLSNSLSRYFMIGLRANFQKWGGRPQRGGKDLNRKGDGSFIY